MASDPIEDPDWKGLCQNGLRMAFDGMFTYVFLPASQRRTQHPDSLAVIQENRGTGHFPEYAALRIGDVQVLLGKAPNKGLNLARPPGSA